MSELLDQEEILSKTRAFVQKVLENEGTGHDWWHIKRVRDTAMMLAEREGADPFVTELGALLHDIADHKFHDGDEHIGPRTAQKWLDENGVPQDVSAHVVRIVKEVSFRGAEVDTPVSSKESAVVQDADRLDAMGAIGIARAFAYGGSRSRPLFDPPEAPEMHDSFEEYKSSSGSTLNHFYEKLLLLKDRMNTPAAREIAVQRHEFMQQFILQFLKEWDNKQ